MNTGLPTMPHLRVAPRLKRLLELWNPFDYLRLLYWCLFFPQALCWYVVTFVEPRYDDIHLAHLLSGRRGDIVFRKLFLQGLFLATFLAVATTAALRFWGLLDVAWLWGIMFLAIWVFLCVALGILLFGLVFSVPAVVLGSLVVAMLGNMNEPITGIGLGIVLGMLTMSLAVLHKDQYDKGLDSQCEKNQGPPVLFSRAILILILLVMLITLALTLLTSSRSVISASPVVEIPRVNLTVVWWLCFLIAFLTAFLRPGVWLIGAVLAILRPSTAVRYLPHITPLPLPRVASTLRSCLLNDWKQGIQRVNEVLSVSLQHMTARRVIRKVLAESSSRELLPRIVALIDDFYNFKLLRFICLSPRDIIHLVFTSIWSPKFIARLDSATAAIYTGFWLLGEGLPAEAALAFAASSAMGSEELQAIAVNLGRAVLVEDLDNIRQWGRDFADFRSSVKFNLRPAVLDTLHRLETVATEAELAERSSSPLMRSTAIGRAGARITELIADVKESCPQPEAAIVKEAATIWRDILAAAGGQIGEDVLRQPVVNPYEGYSGLPVEQTFVGRQDVLARLETLWATPSTAPLPPVVLYGHRRMGKTSILHHLYNYRSLELMTARTDMQDLIMSDNTAQLLLRFARAVHTAATDGSIDIGPVPNASDYGTTGQASEAFSGLLGRLDSLMIKRRMLLVVDEYELAEEKIATGKFDADFLRYLRSAAQRHRWLGLLFAGRQTLEDELRQYRAVFYGSAVPVKVSFLSREAALELIRQPSDDFALEYEPALADELYHLTNGQPYLLQRLCWELVNQWNDRFLREGEETPRILTLDDLQALLTPGFYDDFFLQADYYFSGVWGEANPDTRHLLMVLAAREDASLLRAELIESTNLEPAATEEAIRSALRHDLIVEENGHFRLAVPLMRQWLIEVHPEELPCAD